MKLKVGKDERFTKGAGTAAKAAIQDVKEVEEAKKKKYEKEVEEVVLSGPKVKAKDGAKAKPDTQQNYQKDYEVLDEIVIPHIYDKGVSILSSSEVHYLLLQKGNEHTKALVKAAPDVTEFLYGWVKIGEVILPSYDLKVIQSKKTGEKFIVSESYDNNIININDMESVHLNSNFGASEIVTFDIPKYIKWDGINFVPGTGLAYGTDRKNYNVLDLSTIGLVRCPIGKNYEYQIYIFGSTDKIVPTMQFKNMIGFSNVLVDGAQELVKFTYEFTPAEESNVSVEFVKDFIHGKEFNIPHELVTQAKTICNSIETGGVTLSQLRKLADILKIKFDVIVSEDVRPKVVFTLPVMTEKNKAIYEMTDMTEEEYNILVNGIEISEGIYGFDELVSAFKSGNYDTKDVQFILDKFRESVKL